MNSQPRSGITQLLLSDLSHYCISDEILLQNLFLDLAENSNSHGIMFFPAPFLSLQQKQETPQAMKIMRPTETQPTMRSSLRLIWQLRPANQSRHSQLTSPPPLMMHSPLRLHRSHSVLVAEIGNKNVKINFKLIQKRRFLSRRLRESCSRLTRKCRMKCDLV